MIHLGKKIGMIKKFDTFLNESVDFDINLLEFRNEYQSPYNLSNREFDDRLNIISKGIKTYLKKDGEVIMSGYLSFDEKFYNYSHMSSYYNRILVVKNEKERLNIDQSELNKYSISNKMSKRIFSEIDPLGEEDWEMDERVRWYSNGKLIEDPKNGEEIIYDDFITDDDFRDFLLDNNAYDEYIENYKKKPLKPFNEIPRYEYINYAFSWDNTPEGHSYWSKLNGVWKYSYSKHD